MPSANDADPRLTGEHVRTISGGSGTVTLVGVVHDHPASVYRVRRVVEALDPDRLALELPPLAVARSERHARGESLPAVFGGEMGTAIEAARPGTAVGIDGPDLGFGRRLLAELRERRPAWGVVRDVIGDTISVTRRAIACRVAAVLPPRLARRLVTGSPVPHDADATDDPETQARDERRQIRRARAFSNAFGGGRAGRATRFADGLREDHMAARLAALRREGDVVAVVGVAHLETLAESLRE